MYHSRRSRQDEDGKGDGDDEGEEEEGGEYISRNSRLVLMLEDELPNCHNQERVDEFAVRIDFDFERNCVVGMWSLTVVACTLFSRQLNVHHPGPA